MRQKIKNALISVSDKSDLKKIIQALKKYKINIFSSRNYWLDIGHPETLIRAKEEWKFN